MPFFIFVLNVWWFFGMVVCVDKAHVRQDFKISVFHSVLNSFEQNGEYTL